MKVYVDCFVHPDKPEIIMAFRQRLVAFQQLLRNGGCELLDCATPGLPFDPRACGVAAFVRYADAVAALGVYPSVGFSRPVREVAIRLGKPRVLFIPHTVDLVREPEGTVGIGLRCLYCTPTFPAKVLHKVVGNSKS